MKISEASKFNENFRNGYLTLALVSLFALTATFLVSNLEFSYEIKTAIFLGITFAYMMFCFVFYQRHPLSKPRTDLFTPEIEEKLLALEEAAAFFSASLKPSETFRLVANRVNEIIPFAACALFLPNQEKTHLRVAQSFGENADRLAGLETMVHEGLAGKTFLQGEAQSDEQLLFEKKVVSPFVLENLSSALTVPLKNNGQVFGVLILYGNERFSLAKSLSPLFEAVGERIAPLFFGSIAFERNLENALTDNLTNLPNERAFFLVLENQIAESQRFREQRPLTILSIDIKNFDEINKRFGHGRGDQILSYTAKMIKGQLRQMDFLSRAGGDVFLAVLPTASDEITELIVSRIEKAFEMSPFELNKTEREFIKLNFGMASFSKDGETAEDLLRIASQRKGKAKKTGKGTLLWFPREYVN